MSTLYGVDLNVSIEEQVAKKSEAKLAFEVEYIGGHILSSLAIFNMSKDERTSKLCELLSQAYSEAITLKNTGFKP